MLSVSLGCTHAHTCVHTLPSLPPVSLPLSFLSVCPSLSLLPAPFYHFSSHAYSLGLLSLQSSPPPWLFPGQKTLFAALLRPPKRAYTLVVVLHFYCVPLNTESAESHGDVPSLFRQTSTAVFRCLQPSVPRCAGQACSPWSSRLSR